MKKDYYVYVYIDPRNFEEFYYGKGRGNRKYAHLKDGSDSEKTKRIKKIRKEGLEPIIKVIAKDLTSEQALLVEKTLIWRLGRNLTNISGGHYSNNFRPKDTMHKNIDGFDFKNGIFLVNVGESKHRKWKECKKYGFLSAGQDKKYSDPIRTLKKGDWVIAYLKQCGYVGVGKVIEEAVRPTNFKFKNKKLSEYDLGRSKIFENSDNEKSEYLVKIKWKKTVNREDAVFKKKSGLFTTPAIKASLQNQPETIRFVEDNFGIKFK